MQGRDHAAHHLLSAFALRRAGQQAQRQSRRDAAAWARAGRVGRWQSAGSESLPRGRGGGGGGVRPGPVSAMARPGPALPVPARLGPAQPGPARPSPARPCPARPGPARPSPMGARQGPSRRAECRTTELQHRYHEPCDTRQGYPIAHAPSTSRLSYYIYIYIYIHKIRAS